MEESLTFTTRLFLIVSAISFTIECCAGVPEIVRHLIHLTNSRSSAAVRLCWSIRASDRDFAPSWLRPYNVLGGMLRAFAAAYIEFHFLLAIPSSASCTNSSRL